MNKETYAFFEAVMCHWLGDQFRSTVSIVRIFWKHFEIDPSSLFESEEERIQMYEKFRDDLHGVLNEIEGELNESQEFNRAHKEWLD